jgi:two-component sensor histidine kinase
MWPTSLSMRLIWVMMAALAPAVLVAFSNVIAVQSDRTSSMHEDALRAAELVALELEQTVGGAESVLRTVAAAPVTKQGLPECNRLVSEVVGAVDFLAAIIIMESDGSVRCTSEPSDQSRRLLAAANARNANGSEGPTVGLALPGEIEDELLLPVHIPIDGHSDGLSAIALGFLDLRWLQQRLEDRMLAPGSSITIADRDGTILARVPLPKRFVGTKIPDDFLYLVKADEPGSLAVLSQDGTQRVIGYFPPSRTGSGLYISAGISTAERYALLRDLSGRSAAITLIGTLIASALALYTARVFIARPVRTVIGTVAAWRDGVTSSRTGLDDRMGEIGVAGRSLDAFMDELLESRKARAKAEETRELLRDELEHREKNLLATVQAIARQTFTAKANQDALNVFSRRLEAISAANRLLKRAEWQNTRLSELITNTVATFVGDDRSRVIATGPDLTVKGNVATALAMAVHELCTNAVKYGALGTEKGGVRIEWEVIDDGSGRLFKFRWSERGGPPVSTPPRSGFGSKVIRQALAAQTGGQVQIDYDPIGLTCTLLAPASSVLASVSDAA